MDKSTVAPPAVLSSLRSENPQCVLLTSPQSRPREVYLHPGQSYVATSPAVLTMILGSCAGVFLFDPALAVGAATHFMLPRHNNAPASARYGDVAVTSLIEKFRALRGGQSLQRNVQAKVFGGASMLSALRNLQGSHLGDIGQRNVEMAIELLAQARIAIVDKNVLGDRGRRVSMVSHTGEVALKFVSNGDGK